MSLQGCCVVVVFLISRICFKKKLYCLSDALTGAADWLEFAL